MIFTSSCCDNLSIDEIIERAEKGDCEAQYIVGFYYNRDSAIDSPDDEKAFYWLKLAAEQGHCEAQYSLGQKYTEDKSRHKDNKQAIFWLKKAALQGHTFASNALGWTLDRGEAPNYKEAVVWYQIAAESGMSYAQNNLGWMYRNGNGVAKTMRWHFSGTNKLHYKAIVTRKTIWPIFMKTEKALLKTRHSPHSGI